MMANAVVDLTELDLTLGLPSLNSFLLCVVGFLDIPTE
jgi:hypothetical protein